MALFQRLERGLFQFLSGPAASSTRPAEPLSCPPGISAFLLSPETEVPPLEPPDDWLHDPVSGEMLPSGILQEIPPHRFRAARIASRHGWFATLARRAALGENAAKERALSAMEAWLRQDLPGQGIAWVHASDLAIRLIHWHAGLCWLEVPVSLRESMAGSARWHLRHLEQRRPLSDSEGLRRILHACGMIVGGFTFPTLPESRTCRSEGLTDLRFGLCKLLYEDGVGRDRAFAWQAQVWWAVAIARAVTLANGAPFPSDAEAVFERGARFLADLAGETGTLPAIGEEPPEDLLAATSPLAWSLYNLSRGPGIAPAADKDPRLGWLRAHHSGEPLQWAGRQWGVWSYREGKMGIAWMQIRSKPSRVVLDAGIPNGSMLGHRAPLNLLWQVDRLQILADPGTAAGATDLLESSRSHTSHNVLHWGEIPETSGLERARVDGKKARMDGWCSGKNQRHSREVLLNQSRLLITDRLEQPAEVTLTWQLGPGWVVEPSSEGWIAKNGSWTLVILLPKELQWQVYTGQPAPEPAGWVWEDGKVQEAPCLVGRGKCAGKILSSFELR